MRNKILVAGVRDEPRGYDRSMSDDPRLPITIRSIPGGAAIELADGRRLFIYGRDPDVARAANAMTKAQAEALAKDVARALTAAWDK